MAKNSYPAQCDQLTSDFTKGRRVASLLATTGRWWGEEPEAGRGKQTLALKAIMSNLLKFTKQDIL